MATAVALIATLTQQELPGTLDIALARRVATGACGWCSWPRSRWPDSNCSA